MTQVITRLFSSVDAAHAQMNKMQLRGFPRHAMQVLPQASDVQAKLADAGVADDTAKAYSKHKSKSSAVLLVNATFKPLGAARIAREMLDEVETVDMGALDEESYFKTTPEKSSSVMKDHPRFLTLIGAVTDRGPITGAFGMRMLQPLRTKRSAMRDGGRRMSRAFWPMSLLKEKRGASSVISGGRHMSKTFWPMPLVSNKPRRSSVIRDGDHPLSRRFGWATISSK
ncbi:MAG: hypothetical protein ABJM43_00135 [Paracoccaceae bacterium]